MSKFELSEGRARREIQGGSGGKSCNQRYGSERLEMVSIPKSGCCLHGSLQILGVLAAAVKSRRKRFVSCMHYK